MKLYIHFKAMLVRFWYLYFYNKNKFPSYLVISSVSPNNGSTAGGTILTIAGNYFDNSATYPLVVNVGGQPCTVLSVTTTSIQCQTSTPPSGSPTRFQG